MNHSMLETEYSYAQYPRLCFCILEKPQNGIVSEYLLWVPTWHKLSTPPEEPPDQNPALRKIDILLPSSYICLSIDKLCCLL